MKRKLPSRRLTYQQERDATLLWKREKPSNRRQTIWSRLLEFLDSGERIRRKIPPKTNKEASCGQIPNPEFSDWSEKKKNFPVQKQFEGKPWNHMQMVHKFFGKDQKRTRDDLRNPNNPFLQRPRKQGHRSIHLERRWRSWKMPKEQKIQIVLVQFD